MDLTWDIDREGDASLVRCRVCNDAAVPRRVRIESRLDAPVLPPRRGGVPEDGWDESGVTLRLDAGERRAIGFAARSSPAEPPVEIADIAAVDPTAGSEGSESPTAAALRRLEDHRPPEAAVTGGAGGSAGSDGLGGSDGVPDADASDTENPDADASGEVTRTDAAKSDTDGPALSSTGTEGWTETVEQQLDAVEARIDRAERLTDADLATATAAVAEADGVEEFSGLDERVAADAKRLRALSERASTLAARAEATDAPIEALERLA
ncbi:hypothetical protein [Halorubrum sp. N11]|uniref:DUF7857 domain-containing protein n=1 Tax=Halorubrum sp. N11 TaxID=3402276 RepID=UPI003EBCD84A